MSLVRSDLDPRSLFVLLAGLEEIYPGFREWYLCKVVPGIRRGDRAMFAEVNDSCVVGLSIVKRSATERKICTLWKDPAIAGDATAARLMRSAMAWLETEKPSFTVPSDRIQRLRPVLNEFGVGAGMAVGQLYRPGIEEFLFNSDGMR